MDMTGLIAELFAEYLRIQGTSGRSQASRESLGTMIESQKTANGLIIPLSFLLRPEERQWRKEWIRSVKHPKILRIESNGDGSLVVYRPRTNTFCGTFTVDNPMWGKIFRIARMCDDIGIMYVDEYLSLGEKLR